MTAVLPQSGADLWTFDDFCAYVADGQKADLIDGWIYMASPDTPRNNQLEGFIRVLLDGYVSAKGLGEVFTSRVAFKLSEHNAPEPDVSFVAAGRLEIIQETRVFGPPDVAVEIVSRDSQTRDHLDKKLMYARHGLREYWLIDPLQRRSEFYRLRGDGYELMPLERNSIFRSEVVPGFWLNVDWLLADPLPDKFQCLQQVLAGDLTP